MGTYTLTYCDGDTLVGRASQGVYIFSREAGAPGVPPA